LWSIQFFDAASDVKESPLKPRFIWLTERSSDEVPLLSIKIGNEDLIAILKRYNPIPVELDRSRSKVDPCIFKGRLSDESDSQVLVTGGCPGSDTFDVSLFFLCHIIGVIKFQISKKKKYKEDTRENLGRGDVAFRGKSLLWPGIIPLLFILNKFSFSDCNNKSTLWKLSISG
jgi:hypothetical protein